MDPAAGFAPLSYTGAAPLIVAASSNHAMRRALALIDESGFRVGAALNIADALQRIAVQPRASAIWVEVDEDHGAELDQLLAQVAQGSRDGRYSAIVSASADVLDVVVAGLDGAPADILVDANDAERTSALAIAANRGRFSARVHDVAADRSSEQLRQLSEEVNRIATMLSRLSTGPAAAPPSAIVAPPTGDVPSVAVETVRSVIRARRLRSRYFSDHLFADPAWDMLLDLLQAELSHLRVPVSSLCIAAAVPATTALRWLKTMVDEGLFLRRADPHDGRRVFVELAPETRSALHRYFAEVEKAPVV